MLSSISYPNQVVRLPRTGDPAINRNVGLAWARTDYVAFLDDDDAWHPGKLATQLRDIRANRALVSASNALRVTAGKVEGPYHLTSVRLPTLKDLLISNSIITSSVLVRTEAMRAIGGFPLLRQGEDYAAWLRLSAIGIVSLLNETLVDYSMPAARSVSATHDDLLRYEVFRDLHHWMQNSSFRLSRRLRTQVQGALYQESIRLGLTDAARPSRTRARSRGVRRRRPSDSARP